jgi:hypothetical protein
MEREGVGERGRWRERERGREREMERERGRERNGHSCPDVCSLTSITSTLC